MAGVLPNPRAYILINGKHLAQLALEACGALAFAVFANPFVLALDICTGIRFYFAIIAAVATGANTFTISAHTIVLADQVLTGLFLTGTIRNSNKTGHRQQCSCK